MTSFLHEDENDLEAKFSDQSYNLIQFFIWQWKSRQTFAIFAIIQSPVSFYLTIVIVRSRNWNWI